MTTLKKTCLEPLEDRVLIFPDPPPEQKGGLTLTETHKKSHQPPKGTVIAVGPGKEYDGGGLLFKIYKLICKFLNVEVEARSVMPLKPGDRVFYGQYADLEVEDSVYKEKFLCLRLSDCFLKIQDGDELDQSMI